MTNAIECIAAPNLSKYTNIRHGFFARSGGCSADAFESLNTGLDLGDDIKNVIQNRKIITNYIGSKIALVNQDHTNTVSLINKDNIDQIDADFTSGKTSHIIADALITTESNIALSVESADCVPSLIFASDIKYVAAIHSGWKGSIGGINQKVIRLLMDCGADPKKMSVACGPSISQCNYVVQSDFMEHFISIDPDSKEFFDIRNGIIRYDNKGYVMRKIMLLGVYDIFDVQIDTFVDKRFFSYRREGRTGRFISFIELIV